MIEWFKSTFRREAKVPPPAAPEPFDLNTATLAEIDDANVALGQRIDAIRAQRKLLVARAAELREKC